MQASEYAGMEEKGKRREKASRRSTSYGPRAALRCDARRRLWAAALGLRKGGRRGPVPDARAKEMHETTWLCGAPMCIRMGVADSPRRPSRAGRGAETGLSRGTEQRICAATEGYRAQRGVVSKATLIAACSPKSVAAARCRHENSGLSWRDKASGDCSTTMLQLQLRPLAERT